MKKLFLSLLVLSLFISGCALTADRELKAIIGPEEAKAKAEEFINAYLVDASNRATVKSIEESENYSDYYKITVDTDQSQDIVSLISKDGTKFLMRDDAIDMEEYATEFLAYQASQGGQEAPSADSYSAEDLEKVKGFISCLKEKNFMVYGANWCGYTKSLVETLGGYEAVDPVYTECTQETEVCSSKVDQGYPTIRINDQVYNGPRTLDDLGSATGCAVPELSMVRASTADANCGI